MASDICSWHCTVSRAVRDMKQLVTTSIPNWRSYWCSACCSVLVSQAGCNGRVTSSLFFLLLCATACERCKHIRKVLSYPSPTGLARPWIAAGSTWLGIPNSHYGNQGIAIRALLRMGKLDKASASSVWRTLDCGANKAAWSMPAGSVCLAARIFSQPEK